MKGTYCSNCECKCGVRHIVFIPVLHGVGEMGSQRADDERVLEWTLALLGSRHQGVSIVGHG